MVLLFFEQISLVSCAFISLDFYNNPGCQKFHHHIMALGKGQCFHVPLLVINFIFYFISACIAGWGINKFMNGDSIGMELIPKLA